MSVTHHDGFHAKDGWYFESQEDGSVKISAAVQRVTEAITLTPAEWASVIAAVSAQGETSETYQAALRLHAPEFTEAERETNRLLHHITGGDFL